MILRQFLHTEPVVAVSYLVGCGGKSSCVVIDPVDTPEHYLRAAADLGMGIRYVVDTHVHADHLSTGRALAELAGAVSSGVRVPHPEARHGFAQRDG